MRNVFYGQCLKNKDKYVKKLMLITQSFVRYKEIFVKVSVRCEIRELTGKRLGKKL